MTDFLLPIRSLAWSYPARPHRIKAIAAELRAVGILEPGQLAELTPLSVSIRLAGVMAERHDPCVLYTLRAVPTNENSLARGVGLTNQVYTQEIKQGRVPFFVHDNMF